MDKSSKRRICQKMTLSKTSRKNERLQTLGHITEFLQQIVEIIRLLLQHFSNNAHD